MRLPHRSIKSIQPLPSIYTTFPANYDSTHSSNSSNHSGINSGTCFLRQIEDGIEVVPLERSKTPSAPIFSPDQVEKEVYVVSQKDIDLAKKPLPTPPRSIWGRMSARQKILAVCGVQIIMLLTVGLALLALRSHHSKNNNQPTVVRTAGDESSSNSSSVVDPLQRGTFAVPVKIPQQQSSACLARMNQSLAWQCASNTTFKLNILPQLSDGSNRTMVTLGAPPNNDGITYGHQIPDLQPSELRRLENTDATDDSVAFYFRTTYNRVVLISEEDLLPADKPMAQPSAHNATFQPGQSLWRCIFNETLMEGYIYVHQSSASDLINATSSVNATATTAAQLPNIPYVIKLVEQRMPNGKKPYCEKMVVKQDGTLAQRSGKIQLAVSEPASEVIGRRERSWSFGFRERRETQSAKYCRCQWLYQ